MKKGKKKKPKKKKIRGANISEDTYNVKCKNGYLCVKMILPKSNYKSFKAFKRR